MPIMCIFRVPNVTSAHYDAMRRKVGWEENPPSGGIAHFLTFNDGGAVEYDVWESRASFEGFHKARMEPALRELGIDMGTPEIVPLDGIAIAEAVARGHLLPRGAPAESRVMETDALA